MRGVAIHLLRWLRLGAAALAAGAAMYLLAGIGGSLIPANSGWRQPDTGIEIFVYDNGVHTGLVLPRANAVADWSELVRPEDLGEQHHASEYLLFGWGDRVFYLETPSWSDLRPRTALTALFGSEAALIHVDHVATPVPADNMRSIIVTPQQYARIANAIRADFARDASGSAQPVTGYGVSDVFYEAHGRYSAIRTCNEWTGGILRQSGIRVGVWTPFNFGVMRWF